ncbi:DUF397 domain-containing protein [Streptomyces avicenniae]|uniref:DUF397 domain-containing protein n=1 Tax=Streptomyces avicenniae TaxID=500153 RepID=UPI00069B7D34|nr:DUF397 domain-containing protein [Streptomyces avicenniae]
MSPEKEEPHGASLVGKWFKSSFSNGSGDNCVELMLLDGGVAVRDSKFPGRTPQRYTRAEFAAFVACVKAGDFGTSADWQRTYLR